MAARVFPSLAERDDDSLCPGTKYISPSGLVFHTQCNQQLSSASGESYLNTFTKVKSFEDCIGYCGTLRPLCYAVAYHPVNNHCLFYGSQKDLLGDDGDGKLYSVGMANLQQVTPPSNTSCPYNTGESYTTSSGLEFEIECHHDYGQDAGDYCSDPQEDYTCPPHTDTMEECMSLCSAAHPLCQGVTFNPGMEDGYGNCYLKRDPFLTQNPIPPSSNCHSAQVKKSTLFDIDTVCGTDTTNSYTTVTSGSSYNVSCYETRIGSQNISTTHATSIDKCLDVCSDVDGCKGVVYDMSLGYGYENCYIQNLTGEANVGANATFALRLSDNNDPSHHESETWIAGPVVGAIVAIVLLIALGLWWRKRKARKHVDDFDHDPKQSIYEKDSRKIHEKDHQPRVYELGPGAHGAHDRRYELRDLSSEAMLQHEMPRSP